MFELLKTPVMVAQLSMVLALILINVVSMAVLMPPYASGEVKRLLNGSHQSRRSALEMLAYPTPHCEDFGRFNGSAQVSDRWAHQLVSLAFERAGFTVTTSMHPEAIIDWSLSARASEAKLRNHISGLQQFTHKASLMRLALRESWSFIAPGCSTKDECRVAITKAQQANLNGGVKRERWVVKSVHHKQVKLLVSDSVGPESSSDRLIPPRNMFTQMLIESPLLIDGTSFDIGMYVLLRPSGASLHIEVFQDVLIRACRKQYNPDDLSDPETWVIGKEYKHPHELPSLLSFLSDTSEVALRKYLRQQGIDPRAVWADMHAIVNTVVKTSAKHIVLGDSNVFELVRFDFLLSNKGKVWLMEANMSPNLVPKSPRQRARLLRLIEDVTCRVVAPEQHSGYLSQIGDLVGTPVFGAMTHRRANATGESESGESEGEAEAEGEILTFGCSASKIENTLPVAVMCSMPLLLTNAHTELNLNAYTFLLGFSIIMAIVVAGIWEVANQLAAVSWTGLVDKIEFMARGGSEAQWVMCGGSRAGVLQEQKLGARAALIAANMDKAASESCNHNQIPVLDKSERETAHLLKLFLGAALITAVYIAIDFALLQISYVRKHLWIYCFAVIIMDSIKDPIFHRFPSITGVYLSSWLLSRQEPLALTSASDVVINLIAFSLPTIIDFSGFSLDQSSEDWKNHAATAVQQFSDLFLFTWGDGLARIFLFAQFYHSFRRRMFERDVVEQQLELDTCRGIPGNHAPIGTSVLFFIVGIVSSLMNPWLCLLALIIVLINMAATLMAAKRGVVNLNQTEVDVWMPATLIGCLWVVWLVWLLVLVPLDNAAFGWRLVVLSAVLLASWILEMIVVRMLVAQCRQTKESSGDCARDCGAVPEVNPMITEIDIGVLPARNAQS